MKDQASGITGIPQIVIKNFYESDYLFNIVFIIIRFCIELLVLSMSPINHRLVAD